MKSLKDSDSEGRDSDDDEDDYGDLPDVLKGEYPPNWNPNPRQVRCH